MFMKPQVEQGTFVRENEDSDWIPQQYAVPSMIRDEDTEKETGFFCRLSAPGYLDCTEWMGPFDDKEQAIQELCDVFAESDEEEAAFRKYIG